MKLENWIGLLGLIVLQSNALPFILKAASGELPPTIIPSIMTIIGLSCYMYRAVKMADWLYITGNGIGIGSNLMLLYYFTFV